METEKNINTHFPEVKGLEINFETPGLSNGGSPNIMIQDEVGIVSPNVRTLEHQEPTESYKGMIWDASAKPGEFQWDLQGKDPAVSDIQAGAEPVITTAGDFYEQLREQPRVVQANVLIKPDKIYTIRRVNSAGGSKSLFVAGSDLTRLQQEIVIDKILGEYRSQGDEVAVAIKKRETKPAFNNGGLLDQMVKAMDQKTKDDFAQIQYDHEKNLMFGSGVPAEKFGVDPEKAFGINLHKSYFGDDVEKGDAVTAFGLAMMHSKGCILPDPAGTVALLKD